MSAIQREGRPAGEPGGLKDRWNRPEANTSACSDCNAALADGLLEHEPSCPFERAFDAVIEADRVWFLIHKRATVYLRPISEVEAVEQRRINGYPEGSTVYGQVEVTQLRPGVRTRRLVDGFVMLPDGGDRDE